MEEQVRPNLFTLLKPEFRLYDILLDVGCSSMADLFDFKHSPFKKLIGLDKHSINPFFIYRKKEIEGMSIEEKRNLTIDPEKDLEVYNYLAKRFDIRKLDIRDFTFEPNLFSFIICNKVLHFFPDDEKFELIDKFYKALQQDGLMYLRINHTFHPDLFDRSKSDLIGKNAVKPRYRDNSGETNTVYYMDPEKLGAHLAKYESIPAYYEKNASNITVVIRKSIY